MIKKVCRWLEQDHARHAHVILYSERGNAGDIARYLDQNQSYRIGLDGADRTRVGIVRDALVKAGVPTYRIETGNFGDEQLARDGRVEMLLSTR